MTISIATHGHDCVIGSTIVSALQTQFAGTGVVVRDNPVRAAMLEEGSQQVIFEDQANRRGTGGVPAQRTYGFSVAALSRDTDARTQAHALYQTARRVVLGIMPALTAAGITIAADGMVEGDVTYRVENLDVGGGLVLGLFTIQYRRAATA
jgi:hypothetical protein